MIRRRLPIFRGSCVALLFAASLGYGWLVSPRALVDLVQSSDLIVVASASGAVQEGPPVANFELHVNRVLKGDPAIAGGVIPVSWVRKSSGMIAPGTQFPVAGNGLWFLQRSSDGWLLQPVLQGAVSPDDTFFPTPSGPILAAYAYQPTASLSDRVASELSAAIESDTVSSTQLRFLHHGILDELNSPVVRLLYQRMSTSGSAQHRILGLSGLIRGESVTALRSAVSAASEFEGYPMENGELLSSIQEQFRATDANSVGVLGQAAVGSTTHSPAMREAAVHALASIHTVETLPYLATLLDDPDAELRIEAIGGLASFANGLTVRTPACVPSLACLQFPASARYMTPDTIANFAMGAMAIEQKEASYLSFWKNWWSQQRAGLGY
jgi:hypothetical protein